jgi:hypothetical protein
MFDFLLAGVLLSFAVQEAAPGFKKAYIYRIKMTTIALAAVVCFIHFCILAREKHRLYQNNPSRACFLFGMVISLFILVEAAPWGFFACSTGITLWFVKLRPPDRIVLFIDFSSCTVRPVSRSKDKELDSDEQSEGTDNNDPDRALMLFYLAKFELGFMMSLVLVDRRLFLDDGFLRMGFAIVLVLGAIGTVGIGCRTLLAKEKIRSKSSSIKGGFAPDENVVNEKKLGLIQEEDKPSLD